MSTIFYPKKMVPDLDQRLKVLRQEQWWDMTAHEEISLLKMIKSNEQALQKLDAMRTNKPAEAWVFEAAMRGIEQNEGYMLERLLDSGLDHFRDLYEDRIITEFS